MTLYLRVDMPIKDDVKNTDEKKTSDVSPEKIAIIMLGTVADTTWRLFIPSIGGTLLGLWVDKSVETTPLFTVIGVLVGSLIAFWLVYIQIKKSNK